MISRKIWMTEKSVFFLEIAILGHFLGFLTKKLIFFLFFREPLPTRRTTRNQPAKSPSPPPPREPSPRVPSPRIPSPKIPSPRPASPDETVQPNGNLPSKPPVRSYTRSTRNTGKKLYFWDIFVHFGHSWDQNWKLSFSKFSIDFT